MSEKSMQVLAFSDLHGDVSTLKLLKENTAREEFDCILVAGDLTNADVVSTKETIRQVNEVFSIMESFKTPYYYVWGLPNREHKLASLIDTVENPSHYEVGEGSISASHGEQEEEAFVFRRKSPEEGCVSPLTYITKNDWEALNKTERFLKSLEFGRHVKEKESIKLGKCWLTSSPKRLPHNAIFLQHHYRSILPRALIQLDGHLHFGQRVLNYLNLGFLYRDAAHRASPMIGCYWKLNIEGADVEVSFRNLGGKLKEFSCPNHPQEGKFYIPNYWKQCPVCYEPTVAIMK